ncbi:MAG: B12-binding domain-containing radical SAM protein [Candidatus Scalindua sp.]|jgi:anaerobic magnesium-protoporphyrin IX monomethyl ester cyclase|nr:B12-binding domain-containing radical SAM protein [Candidatus Scalindua sp.]
MKILFVIYDNGSYIHSFPLGVAYISAVLLEEGYHVEIYNQDANHYSDEHLTRYLNKNRFDIVGVGIIGGYYQYRKLLKLSAAINKSSKRPLYILGGHGPSPEPEYFLKKTQADVVVMGEGEITTLELLKAIKNGKTYKKIKGIAYRDGDTISINGRRKLIADIDSMPFPAYHLFPIHYYRLLRLPNSSSRDFTMTIISGRGCPYKCTFCYRMDKGIRIRSDESIIGEIDLLVNNYGINNIGFNDELLMTSVERTISLSESLIKSGLKIKWRCNGRLNYAKPEVLKIMKRSGCVFINYGIESMDNRVLKNMKKGLTTTQIVKGVKETIKAGITPGLNVLFGNLGDNKETLNKGVELLLTYGDATQFRTIRPVTPYPGSPLYYSAIEKGLLEDCEDFYENKHVNSDLLAVNFTDLSDEEFYSVLCDANTRIIKDYYKRKTDDVVKQTENLYKKKDIHFRGFRMQ